MNHRLAITLAFPVGLSAGAGQAGNRLIIARDGRGRPVLRGTALTGALRHAWTERYGAEQADSWFGSACDETGRELRHESPLRVPDIVLDAGKSHDVERTHNLMNRHTGAVLPGGLFSLEAMPPGSLGEAVLTLTAGEEDGRAFLQQLLSCLQGLHVGGSVARGIGMVEVQKHWYRLFDPENLDDVAAGLDEQHTWLRDRVLPKTGEQLASSAADEQRLVLSLSLQIPEGQDLLVGDGQGLDVMLEPQTVKHADGKTRLRIPGSALRGPLRAWIARLAARDGRALADADPTKVVDGDALGWGNVPKEQRQHLQQDPDQVTCPILQLFGSCYARSRIWISDGYATGSVSLRRHVAVDRISGGANDGMLFDNRVVDADAEAFAVTITIDHPDEHEATWLYSALRALDLGLVRVGSSKSAGRLSIGDCKATGRFSQLFDGIKEVYA